MIINGKSFSYMRKDYGIRCGRIGKNVFHHAGKCIPDSEKYFSSIQCLVFPLSSLSPISLFSPSPSPSHPPLFFLSPFLPSFPFISFFILSCKRHTSPTLSLLFYCSLFLICVRLMMAIFQLLSSYIVMTVPAHLALPKKITRPLIALPYPISLQVRKRSEKRNNKVIIYLLLLFMG